MIWRRTLGLAVVLVISGGFMQARAAESLQTRQVLVNGVDLIYLDQGTGAPVVFVHGAFSDLRFWEPQRQAVAKQYRFIAFTQRYFGTPLGRTTGSTMRRRPITPTLGRSSAKSMLVQCIWWGFLMVESSLRC